MKDDVNLVERGGDRVAIAQVAFNELSGRINPVWFAAFMRVRF